jgi:N-methylhydantoinase A/oxoprolinase/acetone carboxylase beta subunit
VSLSRNNDLIELKKLGSPFTKESDVENLLNSTMTEEDKQMRLYIEVRYAGDTALSVPKQKDIQFVKGL